MGALKKLYKQLLQYLQKKDRPVSVNCFTNLDGWIDRPSWQKKPARPLMIGKMPSS
jgi:hypothetical protein